jgi:hypothetical protein
MRRGVAGLVALAGALGAGCSAGTDPETFPTHEVRGTVVVKATGQPLTEGGVEFLHAKDPRFNCKGPIDSAGRFTLTTIAGTKKLSGAAEGEYAVIVRRPMGADQVDRKVTLKKTQHVKAGTNTITLELDRLP